MRERAGCAGRGVNGIDPVQRLFSVGLRDNRLVPFPTPDFVGHTALLSLVRSSVPAASGVYVITRVSPDTPRFLASSPAGWINGKDPSLPIEELEAAWIPGETVVYIGKATNLRTRLATYRRHGAGTSARHWGGRMIWQLADHAELRVAWRECDEPRNVEREMIESFRQFHGKRPFANRTG